LARVRDCGRITHISGAGPTLRLSKTDDGVSVAGYAGLVSCGSVWSCPTCAAKIGNERAGEIKDLVRAVDSAGGGAGLITLTLRHHRGHRLDEAWGALRHAWSRVTSGKTYMAEVTRFGIDGWACAVEVTHGADHGWHPHAHVLVIFDRPVSDETVETLAGRWWLRWSRALARKGFDAIADRGGLDARQVRLDPEAGAVLGGYLSKIAREVTGGHTKTGRLGNRTPFHILDDALTIGLVDDFDLWSEWEQASRGRRQLTWSRGLRDRYGVRHERSDDEIAADDDLASDDLVALPAETWREVRPVAEDLLTVAEREGLPGVVRWLDARGLGWMWATRAPRRDRGRVNGRSATHPVSQ
jgi:hypothetical protein